MKPAEPSLQSQRRRNHSQQHHQLQPPLNTRQQKPHLIPTFEESDETEYGRLDYERYADEETCEPVEAYAGIISNAKTLAYVMTLCASAPAASAMHGPENHEHHGLWGIQLLWIILVPLLLCLAYAIG